MKSICYAKVKDGCRGGAPEYFLEISHRNVVEANEIATFRVFCVDAKRCRWGMCLVVRPSGAPIQLRAACKFI